MEQRNGAEAHCGRRRERRGPQSRRFTWADIAEKSSRLKGVLQQTTLAPTAGRSAVTAPRWRPDGERPTPSMVHRSERRAARFERCSTAAEAKPNDVPLNLDRELTIATDKVCFIIVKAR
jgi:hypothetical protein